jgi:hypothetical protein
MNIRFDKCGLTARGHSAEENKPCCLRNDVYLENLVLTQTNVAFQGNIDNAIGFSCFAPFLNTGEQA